MDVYFTVSNNFGAGNVFTAQLSNASGAFTNPVTIGTLASVTSGVINATIPASGGVGNSFRIRVVSSVPVVNTSPPSGYFSLNLPPTAAQAAITVSGALSICSYETVNFSVPSTTGFSYQWYHNGTSLPGATSNVYSATDAGVYYCIVTGFPNPNGFGCDRSSASKTVIIKPTPVATISPNTTQSICGAQTVTFTANIDTGLTYKWYNNGTLIGGATNNTYTASAGGNYAVEVTKTNGCANTSPAVTVLSGSCGAAVSDIGILNVCQGGSFSVNFTSTSFNANNTLTLQLSNSAGSFSGAQNIGTLATAGGPGSITGTIPAGTPTGTGYKLRIKSNHPITTGPTSQLTLKVGSPITDIIGLCAVTVDTSTGKNLLIWDKPVSSNIDSFVIYRKPNLGTVYERIGAQAYGVFSTYLDTTSQPEVLAQRYYITGKNGCGETPMTDVHRTLHLTINKGMDYRTWNLIWSGYEGFPHNNYTIWRRTQFDDMEVLTTVEANEYNSYTDFEGPWATGGAMPFLYYMVSVTDGPACNPTARTTGGFNVNSNIATNANMLPDASWLDLQVFPNPSAGSSQFLIQSSSPDVEYDVRIVDISGRTMESYKTKPGAKVVFGSMLAPGVYAVEVKGNGGRLVKKWIKQS